MFFLKLFSAMIQQPRVPSSGLMPASDVLIRAKEVDVLYLLCGQCFEMYKLLTITTHMLVQQSFLLFKPILPSFDFLVHFQ